MLVSQLAKKLEMNPTNLVEKVEALGIFPVHGPHIDATPINIFLRNSIISLRKNDFENINKYPTRTGRLKEEFKSLEIKKNYYSLYEAGKILGISSSKVSVLVNKGILKQKPKNPFDIKITKSTLFKLKKKLISSDYITFNEAAEKIKCPLNWMKKYWCLTGYLTVEDYFYWKLIKKNEVNEVLKLKEEYVTGAEASKILDMKHNHVTNLHKQGLIRAYYIGKTETKIRLFKKEDILKLLEI